MACTVHQQIPLWAPQNQSHIVRRKHAKGPLYHASSLMEIDSGTICTICQGWARLQNLSPSILQHQQYVLSLGPPSLNWIYSPLWCSSLTKDQLPNPMLCHLHMYGLIHIGTLELVSTYEELLGILFEAFGIFFEAYAF